MLSSQMIELTLTLGLVIALAAGDFDLSVSANAVMCGIVTALAVNDWHMAAGPAVLCALAVGGLVGLANGLLVVFVGLNAFIATLATMTVYSALALAFTQSAVIVMNPTNLTGLVTRQLLGIPAGVYGTWI